MSRGTSTTTPVALPTILTRWPVTLVALLAGMSCILYEISKRIYPIDLEVYRRGAAQLTAGESLYGQYFHFADLSLPFTYPPFAAWLMQVLNWGSLDHVQWGIIAGNGALVLICAWVVSLRAGLSPQRAVSLAALALPVVWFTEPVLRTNGYAQVNILLMTMVLLDLVPRRTLLPRGVLIGLAAAIKLTPAIFGLYLLLKKDYRGAAWATGTGLAVTAVMWLVYPQDSADFWLRALRDTSRVGYEGYVANQSVKGMLIRAIGEGTRTDQLWLGIVLLIAALTVVTMLALLRRHTDSGDLGAIMVNAAAMLLISPISWSHHYVWAGFVVVILFATGTLARSVSWLIWAALVMVCLYAAPHWGMEYLGHTHGWSFWQQLSASTYPLLAISGMVLALGQALRR